MRDDVTKAIENGNALVPRDHFLLRKTVAWLLIGVCNPIWWALILLLERPLALFGVIGFVLVLPSSIGAALGLLLLPKRAHTDRQIFWYVFAWAMMTILIYAYGFLAYTEIPDSRWAWEGMGPFFAELGHLIAIAPVYLLIGFFPAMFAAILTYPILHFVLFERSSPAQ